MIRAVHFFYRSFFSPFLHMAFGGGGLGCRFEPSCGDYAFEAIKVHGFFKGFCLSFSRVCSCHPWSGRHGQDPAPSARAEEGLFL